MIGNWLYFNPRKSEPKVIDVEMAYNYTNYDPYVTILTYVYGDIVTYFGGLFRANGAVAINENPSNTVAKWDRVGDSYQEETSILSFDSEFRYAFNVIKSAPKDRIIHNFGTDTKINYNKLRGKMLRFTHRYKYFDNSYSTFSAFSDVTLPEWDEVYDGETPGEIPQLNNYLTLSFSPHSGALIKSIEIYFQEIGESWKRCQIINRQEQELIDNLYELFTVDFYNDDAYEVYANPTDIEKVYDSVPKLADSEEIINKNILCYGGVTEGFDNLPKEDIDVVLTPVIETLSVPLAVAALVRNNIPGDITSGENYMYVYYYKRISFDWFIPGNPGMPVATDYYYFRVTTYGLLGFSYRFELQPAHLVSATTLTNAVSAAMVSIGMLNVFPNLVDNYVEIRFYTAPWYPLIFKSEFYTPGVETTALTKDRGFKTGALHPFCLFYYDDSLRRWDAQVSKISEDASDVVNNFTYNGTTVYVPMFNEMTPVPADTARRWTIDWEVNHLPPVGAKYWRWGYAGNGLCSHFVQYIVEGMAQGADEYAHMLKINIRPLNTIKNTTENTWNQLPQTNIDAYTFVEGDRIRFLTETPDDITAHNTRFGDIVTGVYDYEIILQDTTDPNYIYVQYFNYAAVGANGFGENTLVEIYTPIKHTEVREYYEFGDLMPIVEDSAGVLVHGGKDLLHYQDTVTGAPAMGTFGYGDVYHIYRTPSKPLCTFAGDDTIGAFHESMSWSDFYRSDDWDKGKIGFETNFNERYLNIVRFSNPYLQNTQINGLPTFEPNSYKELNDVFGNIVAIYENGDTLKVYQERKSSSIMIGRTEYTDATGNTTVAISSSTLGAIRYSPSNFSTIFPESIARNNKFIYGFDIYNGVMWRDSVNGIFPISGRWAEAGVDADYKMATYFKDKSKALLVSGIDHCSVMSVWDEEFKNLHVVFKDNVHEENNETIVFHEPSNRWICFESLDQTPLGGYNVILELTYDIVKGFVGGLNYDFDEDTRFAIFDLVTGGGVNTAPGFTAGQTLTLTAYPPTSVTITVDYTMVNDETLELVAYPPTDVHISGLSVLPISMTWQAWQYDVGEKKDGVITTSETDAYLYSMPSWMGMQRITGVVLSEGSIVSNGEVLYIYPASINDTGIVRHDWIRFKNGSYDDMCQIEVTQLI
jgi:hypothetical protein